MDTYANDKLALEEGWMGRLEHGKELRDERLRNQLEPSEHGPPNMLISG